jgi:MFS transporter, DHA2 family, multidrug resistance protein
MSSAPPPPIKHRWTIATVATAGTFMAVLDTTIVDIALPKMMSTFEVDLYKIQWVLISYFLGSILSMCCAGWLTNHQGSRNAFLAGLAVFTAFSVTCGMAPNIESMNIARFLQGVGEGFILPTALIILYETFPPNERGVAMGFYGLGILFAPAIGPSFGGFITEHLSWRWIFYINIPVGIVALIVGWMRFPRQERTREKIPFDWPGFILMLAAFTSLILITTKGQEKGWLQSNYIITLLIVFAASFPLFIMWQLSTPRPLLDLRVFRDRNFSLCVIIACLSIVTVYGIWILLPVYIERLRGISTFTAGLILLPGAIASAFAIMAAGALSDRGDPRVVLFVTLMAGAAACFLYTTDLYVSKQQMGWEYAVWMIFVASQYPPINSINLANLPDSLLNMGSTIFNVVRMLFGSIGTAYSTSLLQSKMATNYTILSAKVNYGEPATRQLIVEQMGSQPGQVTSTTIASIKAVLSQYITANATAYSFEGVFQVLGIWMAVCLLFAIFLVKPRRTERMVGH